MTKPTSTHITLILDRSGSMSDIRDDIIGGVNAFFADQRATGHPITATLIQFDGMDPFEVIAENVTLDKISALTSAIYQPRGNTPLLDAIGLGIQSLTNHLHGLKAKARPADIVFVIVTDGRENSSKEYTRAHITGLIKAKEVAGWKFIFLSSDLSAVREARDLDIPSYRSAQFDKSNTRASFSRMSDKIAEFNQSKTDAALAFTDQDRDVFESKK
jgi:Mg-chelatase subunit ChlD